MTMVRPRQIQNGKVVHIGDRRFHWSDALGVREDTGNSTWRGFHGKDMADAVRFLQHKGGPIKETLERDIIDPALSAAEFLWMRAILEHDTSTPDGRAAFEADLLGRVAEIRHPIVRRHYQQWVGQRIASEFGATPPQRHRTGRSNVVQFTTSKSALLNSLARLEQRAADVKAMREEGCYDDPPASGEGE